MTEQEKAFYDLQKFLLALQHKLEKYKIAGIAMTIALLSLAGIPPLAGFMSEWMIFAATIFSVSSIGWIGILISVIALTNALISLGYYLPVIRTLYLKKDEKTKFGEKSIPLTTKIPLVFLTLLIIIIGIYPDIVMVIIRPASEFILKVMFNA